MAAVGLAQNFAALRALVTSGIQRGHMKLHARSVAAAAGASDDNFAAVVDQLIQSGEIKRWKAREILDDLKKPSPSAIGPAKRTTTQKKQKPAKHGTLKNQNRKERGELDSNRL